MVRQSRKFGRLHVLLWLLMLVLTGGSAMVKAEPPQPLIVAVASNFAYPLKQLSAAHAQPATPAVKFVVGASGVLFAQASNGAPFDVFFSADTDRPERLYANDVAEKPVIYAYGKLVLWSKTRPLSPADAPGRILEQALASNHKLAIANPKVAPFGLAAQQIMSHWFGEHRFQANLVFGNNISQTFQFADSSNATYGLLAESSLIHAQRVFGSDIYRRYIAIPAVLYEPVAQAVTVMKTSRNPARAHALVDYVLSADSQKRLTSLGYWPVNDKQEQR